MDGMKIGVALLQYFGVSKQIKGDNKKEETDMRFLFFDCFMIGLVSLT